MKIGVLYIMSDLHGVEEKDRKYVENLSQTSGQQLELVHTIDELNNYDFKMVFIATGGTEGKFIKIVPELPEPIFILTSGESNSLAASMEILSFMKLKGLNGEIIHGKPEYVAKKVAQLAKVFEVKSKLNGFRLGSIGKPSDWLIASDVDPINAYRNAGMVLMDIPMEELFDEINKCEYPSNEFTLRIENSDFDKNEIKKSLEIYGAIKRLCDKYRLNAVTIRCFDLLGPIKSTGCMALAILNAEGIYGGCEGDMQSLVSMSVIGLLSDKPVFMCNPSRILDEKSMIFAHCTLPLNMISEYSLMTHFESGLGVAVRGKIDTGEATVFKCAGDLSRHFVSKANIDNNLCETFLCRTQIQVTLDKGTSYFTTDPIGNHHMVVNGDYSELVDEFFKWVK